MRPWLHRILYFSAAFMGVMILAVYFGGRYAVQKYLSRDISVGEGRVRLVAPKFRWSLDLSADSCIYLSPSLDAFSGRTVVSANLFKSLVRFSPSVSLDVDTLGLVLKPMADTSDMDPRTDSAKAFPDVKLPAAVVVRAARIAISDSGGPLVRGDGILLETRGKRAVILSIRELEARQLKDMRQSLRVAADWEDSQTVAADIHWRQAGDSLALKARLSKQDLRRGEGTLGIRMASSDPYRKALGLAPGPRAENLQGDFEFSLLRSLKLGGRLETEVDGFPDTAAYRVGPQNVALRVDFQDTAGTWSLSSKGNLGEDLDLKGTAFLTGRDSLDDFAYLAKVAGVTAKGHLRGVKVLAGGKWVRANVDIADFRASRQGLRADMRTGDGSRLEADLKLASGRSSPLPPWSGAFSADIKPRERWVSAFTDTQVVFRRFTLRGRMDGGKVEAVSEAVDLKAYGLLADTLRLRHRYDGEVYSLAPSLLAYRKVGWKIEGKAALAEKDRPLAFRMGHPEFGTVLFKMRGSNALSAEIRNLALAKLPYRGLDTLQANRPRLTADFAWNKAARDGHLDLGIDGEYKGEKLRAEAHAAWTRTRLTVQEVRASLAGSEIKAAAKLRLRGQYFELGNLEREDYEEVRLSSNGFDIAKALRVALPEPPLASAQAAGRFAYSAADGFQGTFRIRNLQLKPEDGKFTIEDFALVGKGDSLLLKVATTSPSEPLLNDSGTLAISGLLGKEQALNLTAKMGPGIMVRFQATLRDFKDLKGNLAISGDAVLPQASGEIKGLKIRADMHLPLQEGIKGLRLEADTLLGDYAVAGLDTQAFSAPVKMQGGRVTIPVFALKARSGGELKGKFAFNPSNKTFSGTLAGSSFAAKVGEGAKFKLNDVNVEVNADSTTLTLSAAIGSGSAEHVKSPLRVAGDFSHVAVFYRKPLAITSGPSSIRGGRIPFLRVHALLDSSELRYRLRSMETLQNLFKRSPEKRVAKRSDPMQVQIDLETSGSGNSIETDILRMSYVGNLSMAGILPYALVKGRISSQKGELGAKKQAYAIRRMDVKWLNAPMEEGQVNLEAQKRLARDCESGTLDSCNITTRLTGELADLHFTYDSDCQGGGAGVEVAALIYSVRRGCYSTAFSAGGSGLTRQEQALGLLEPLASRYLSDAVGKLSGHWIASTQVSGLGALATDKKKSGAGVDSGSAVQEAIALEILSKEFWRTRLRLKSAFAPENADKNATPWNYRAALEWRPPVPPGIRSEKWKNRVKNNVSVEAAVYTNPDRTQEEDEGGGLLKRLGINYNYGFWGSLWAKKGAFAKQDSLARPGNPVAVPETIE